MTKTTKKIQLESNYLLLWSSYSSTLNYYDRKRLDKIILRKGLNLMSYRIPRSYYINLRPIQLLSDEYTNRALK